MISHTCYVDCKPVDTVHSVTGETYRSHVMYASEPSSAAGRYQWEQNAEIKRQGRRAWRATGQGESREVRLWNRERAEHYGWNDGDSLHKGLRADMRRIREALAPVHL